MHKYRVVDLLANEGRVVLRCQSGHHHFARALGVLPPVKASLQGDKPHLGFGVLMCTPSKSMFRVIFESINQTESELRSWNVRGHTIGTLCAYDVQPRTLSSDRMGDLQVMANAAAELIHRRSPDP